MNTLSGDLAELRTERERIFERFVRLAHSTQHEKGSGLGLAIVRHVVQAHGGQVTVRLEPVRFSFSARKA